MRISIGHIFTKATIMLMAVFVCLSCSLKREIKQVLNIPVAHLEHFEKPDKTAICQSFSKEENQNISVSCQKKDIQKHTLNLAVDFRKTNGMRYRISFTEVKHSLPVPIYILHEQYLI